jgi:hypothetical protein
MRRKLSGSDSGLAEVFCDCGETGDRAPACSTRRMYGPNRIFVDNPVDGLAFPAGPGAPPGPLGAGTLRRSLPRTTRKGPHSGSQDGFAAAEQSP